MKREIIVNSKGKKVYRYYEVYICKQCGKTFEARKDHKYDYCSHDCQIESMRKPLIKKCKVCENPFNAVHFKEQVYCSQKCMGIDRLRKSNDSEYQIKQIKGKRMGVHRFMMEQYIGRELTDEEVVHHINEIKDDNRIENLVLMLRSEHNKLHMTQDLNIKTEILKDSIKKMELERMKGVG